MTMATPHTASHPRTVRLMQTPAGARPDISGLESCAGARRSLTSLCTDQGPAVALSPPAALLSFGWHRPRDGDAAGPDRGPGPGGGEGGPDEADHTCAPFTGRSSTKIDTRSRHGPIASKINIRYFRQYRYSRRSHRQHFPGMGPIWVRGVALTSPGPPGAPGRGKHTDHNPSWPGVGRGRCSQNGSQRRR